jgi:prepilin-type N-terminal cleavage/methylation domain-containing protein
MHRSRAQHAGFTLIELLIVIAIILILIAIALPNFLEAQIRAQVVNAQGEMRTMSTAVMSFGIDHRFLIFDGWDIEKVEAQRKYLELTGTFAVPVPVDGSPRYYTMLTTPVQYITQIPTDPFSEGGGIQDPDTNLPLEPSYLYIDHERPSEIEADFGHNVLLYRHDNPQAVRKLGEGHFLFMGVGPDRRGFVPFIDISLRGLPYSPTNGTRSVGELVHFGAF